MAQVEIVFQQEDQIVENVFHVSTQAVPLPLDQNAADDIQGEVADWLTTTLRPLQANNLFWYRLLVKDVNDNGPVYEYTGDMAANGGIIGDALPNHVTFSVKKNTAAGGRGFRGRFYHLGLHTGQLNSQDPNRLTDPAVFAIVSTYAALLTRMATAGFPLVLGKRNPNPPHDVVAGVQITSVSARDNTIDSQRRRLPGRGR